MASHLFQQVLSTAGATLMNGTSVQTQNLTNPMPGKPLEMPTDITGLVTLLLSFTGLRDWLKLIVIGGFFEFMRRLFSAMYTRFTETMYMNACFQEEDPSYEWIMVWLSKQPSWKQARDVEISTESFGTTSTAVVLEGDEGDNELSKSSRKLAYLPSLSKTYSLWYKHRLVSITRTQDTTGYQGRKEQTLHVSILTRSNKLLIDILQEARTMFMATQEHSMCVYVSDVNNNWRHVSCRPKRSLHSVVLDPGIKDTLISDARDFLDSKDWYGERGIPFRRGYLLYGAPGSGKTSLIHCVAGELGLDVYIVSLSRAGLDDSSLSELINELPQRCVALMEDIDAAFTHSITDRSSSSDNDSSNATPSTPTSRLSLSGLLNALDGVGAQEGRILFATTNHYSALDPALCRPGRMDLHIEFKLASKYQAKELFCRFYLPNESIEDDTDSVSDSGYASSSDEKEAVVEEKKSFVYGTRHTGRAPNMTKTVLKDLAEKFADAIPERELSMASLQGYLMTYKTRPVEAIREAQAWVAKEKVNRLEKEKKEKAEREKREKREKEKTEEMERKEKEKNNPKGTNSNGPSS